MVDIDTFVGLRFIHDCVPYDPKASADANSKYRIHVVEDSVLNPPAITTLSALTPGSTDNLYSALATANSRVWGCEVYGTTDALVTLELNGVVVAYDVSSTIRKMARIRLPKPIAILTGQSIKIIIKNIGPDTSDFEGSLYIE